MVYELINDFEPLLHNGRYDPEEVTGVPVDTTVVSRPHPGKFPTRGVLRAVLADGARGQGQEAGSVYMRPLLTSGDVLLAMHELLDRKLFRCGCITLPHALRGPMLTDHRGGSFYRCVFRLNRPIVIYRLVPRLSRLADIATANRKETRSSIPQTENNNADLRSFLCPRYHQHLFNFERVGDSAEVDAGPLGTLISAVDQIEPSSTEPSMPHGRPLRPEEKGDLVRQCRLIVGALTDSFGPACLLMHLVLDFDSCIELPEVRPKKPAARSGIQLPAAGAALKSRERASREMFRKHFRLSQISHAEFQERVAPLRRDAVVLFSDEEKTYMKLFHGQVHAEYAARKVGVAGAVAGQVSRSSTGRVGDAVYDRVYTQAQRLALRTHRLPDCNAPDTDEEPEPEVPEQALEPPQETPEQAAVRVAEEHSARIRAEEERNVALLQKYRTAEVARWKERLAREALEEEQARQRSENRACADAEPSARLQAELGAEDQRLVALLPSIEDCSYSRSRDQDLPEEAEDILDPDDAADAMLAALNSPQPNRDGGIASYDQYLPGGAALDTNLALDSSSGSGHELLDSDEAFSAAVAARKKKAARANGSKVVAGKGKTGKRGKAHAVPDTDKEPVPSAQTVAAVAALTQHVVNSDAVAAIRSDAPLTKTERARRREEEAQEKRLKDEFWARHEELLCQEIGTGAGSRGHSAAGSRRTGPATEVVRLPVMGSAAPRTTSRDSNTASNGIAPVAVGLTPAEIAAGRHASPPHNRTVIIPTASQELLNEPGDVFHGGVTTLPGVYVGGHGRSAAVDLAVGETFINSSTELAISEAESHLNLNIRRTDAMKEKKRAQRNAAAYREAMMHAMEDFLQQFVRREADAQAHLLASAAAGAAQGETAASLFQRNRDVVFFTAVAAATNDISAPFCPPGLDQGAPPTDPSVFPLSQYYRQQYQRGGAQLRVDVLHQTKGALTYEVHLPSRSLPLYRPPAADDESSGAGSMAARAYDYGSQTNASINQTPLSDSHIAAFGAHYARERNPYLEAEDEKMRCMEQAYEQEQRARGSPTNRSSGGSKASPARSRATSEGSFGDSPRGAQRPARMRTQSGVEGGSVPFAPLDSVTEVRMEARRSAQTSQVTAKAAGGSGGSSRAGTGHSSPSHGAIPAHVKPKLTELSVAGSGAGGVPSEASVLSEREHELEQTSALLRDISASDLFRQPNMKAFLQELHRLSANSARSGSTLRKQFALARANTAAEDSAGQGALESQFSSMVDNWSVSLGDDASSYGVDFGTSADVVRARHEEEGADPDRVQEQQKRECDHMFDRLLESFPTELADLVRAGLRKRAMRLAQLERMKQKKLARRRRQERKLPKAQVLIDAITGGALEHSSLEYAHPSASVETAGAAGDGQGTNAAVVVSTNDKAVPEPDREQEQEQEQFPTLEEYMTGLPDGEGDESSTSLQGQPRHGTYFDGFNDDDVSSASDDETLTSDMRRAHDEFLALQERRAGGKLWGEENNVFSFQMKTARPKNNVINAVVPEREVVGANVGGESAAESESGPASGRAGYTVISYLEKTKEEYRQLYDQMEGLIVNQRRDHDQDQQQLRQQLQDQHSERLSALTQGLDSAGGVMDLRALPSVYINQAVPVGMGSVFSFGEGPSVNEAAELDQGPHVNPKEAVGSARTGPGEDELKMFSDMSGDAAQHAQELEASTNFAAAYRGTAYTVQEQFRQQELESDARNAAIATNYLNSTRAQAKRARQDERECEWRERARIEAEATYRLVTNKPLTGGGFEECLDLEKIVPPAESFSVDLLSELLYCSDGDGVRGEDLGASARGADSDEDGQVHDGPAQSYSSSIHVTTGGSRSAPSSPARRKVPVARERGQSARGAPTSAAVTTASAIPTTGGVPGGSHMITLAELLHVLNGGGPETERCHLVGVHVGEGAFEASSSGILSPGSAPGASIGFSSIGEESARNSHSSPLPRGHGSPPRIHMNPSYDAHPMTMIDHAAGFPSDDDADVVLQGTRRAIQGSTRTGADQAQRMRTANANKQAISFNRVRTPGKPSTAPATGPESPRESMRVFQRKHGTRTGSARSRSASRSRERTRSPGGPTQSTRLMNVLLTSPDSTDIVVKGASVENSLSLVESPGPVSGLTPARPVDSSPPPAMMPVLFYAGTDGGEPVRLGLNTEMRPLTSPAHQAEAGSALRASTMPVAQRSGSRPRRASPSPGRGTSAAGVGTVYCREYVREDLLKVDRVSPPLTADGQMQSAYDIDGMMDSYDLEETAVAVEAQDSAEVQFVFLEPGVNIESQGQGQKVQVADKGAEDGDETEELTVISQPVVVVSTAFRCRSTSSNSDVSMGASIASGSNRGAGAGAGSSEEARMQLVDEAGTQLPTEEGLEPGVGLERDDEEEQEEDALAAPPSASVDYTRHSVTSPAYSYQVSVDAPVEALLLSQSGSEPVEGRADSPSKPSSQAVPVLVSPRLDKLVGTSSHWELPGGETAHGDPSPISFVSHHFLGHVGAAPDRPTGADFVASTVRTRSPPPPAPGRSEHLVPSGEVPSGSQLDKYLLATPPVPLAPTSDSTKKARPGTAGATTNAAQGSRGGAFRGVKHGLVLVPGNIVRGGQERGGRILGAGSVDDSSDCEDGPAALVQSVRRSQGQHPLFVPHALFEHSLCDDLYESRVTDASLVDHVSGAPSAEQSAVYPSGELPPLPQLQQVVDGRTGVRASAPAAATTDNVFSLDLDLALGSLSLESGSLCINGEFSNKSRAEDPSTAAEVRSTGASRGQRVGIAGAAAEKWGGEGGGSSEIIRVRLSNSRSGSRNASPSNADRKKFQAFGGRDGGDLPATVSAEPSVPELPVSDALVQRVDMAALDLFVGSACIAPVSPPRPRPQAVSASRESSMLSETSAAKSSSQPSAAPPPEPNPVPNPVVPPPGTTKESIERARERIPHILPFRHPQHPQSILYDSKQNVLAHMHRRPLVPADAPEKKLQLVQLGRHSAPLKKDPKVGNKAPRRPERLHISLQKGNRRGLTGGSGAAEGVPSEFVLNNTGTGASRRAATAGSTRRPAPAAAPTPEPPVTDACDEMVEAALSVQRAAPAVRGRLPGSGVIGEDSQITEYSEVLSGAGDGFRAGGDSESPEAADSTGEGEGDASVEVVPFNDDDLNFDNARLKLGFVPRAPLGSQRPSASSSAPRAAALMADPKAFTNAKLTMRTSPIQPRTGGMGIVGNVKQLSVNDKWTAGVGTGTGAGIGGSPAPLSESLVDMPSERIIRRPVSAYAKLARVSLMGMDSSAGVAGSNISISSPAPPS